MSINVIDGQKTYENVESIDMLKADGSLLKTLLLSEQSSGGAMGHEHWEYVNTGFSSVPLTALFDSTPSGGKQETHFTSGLIVIGTDGAPSGLQKGIVVYTPTHVYFTAFGRRTGNTGIQSGGSHNTRSEEDGAHIQNAGIQGSINSYSGSMNPNQTYTIDEYEITNITADVIDYVFALPEE